MEEVENILHEKEAYTQLEPEKTLPLTNEQEGMSICWLYLNCKSLSNVSNGTLAVSIYMECLLGEEIDT